MNSLSALTTAADDSTLRRALFVAEYLIDQNAPLALLRAGYKATSFEDAQHDAEQLLKHPHVAAELSARLHNRLKLTQVTRDRVILELARIAFFDPRKMFEKHDVPGQDGKATQVEIMRDMGEMDEDTSRAITSFDYSKLERKAKPADKLKALELLAKMKGWLSDENTKVAQQATDKLTSAELAEAERLAKGVDVLTPEGFE